MTQQSARHQVSGWRGQEELPREPGGGAFLVEAARHTGSNADAIDSAAPRHPGERGATARGGWRCPSGIGVNADDAVWEAVSQSWLSMPRCG